jgi:hypothetical protein
MTSLTEIAKHLRTQDNRITDCPVFVVQGRRRYYGIDPDYCEELVWVIDGEEEADGEELARLRALHEETLADKDGEWRLTGYHDVWETVQPFFTEAGAEEYLRVNGHNLRHYQEVRIYAESSFRNEEWRAIRDHLLTLEEP